MRPCVSFTQPSMSTNSSSLNGIDTVVGDSIIGESGTPLQRVAVAAADVQVVTTPKAEGSPVRTGLVVASVTLVTLTVVGYIWLHSFADGIDKQFGGK